MEESHTKEQSPKQFCERCFEQGDRKWQQNELGLGFELVFRVWGRKECVSEIISGGGPPWAHEEGGAPRGVGRALHPRGQVAAPPAAILALKILKYSRKNQIKLAWHSEDFYFRDIFYCTDNSENKQIILFFFIYFK